MNIVAFSNDAGSIRSVADGIVFPFLSNGGGCGGGSRSHARCGGGVSRHSATVDGCLVRIVLRPRTCCLPRGAREGGGVTGALEAGLFFFFGGIVLTVVVRAGREGGN